MKTAVERFKELMLLKAEVLNCDAFKDPEMLSVLDGCEEVLGEHIRNMGRIYLDDHHVCPHCIINAEKCFMCEWGVKYGVCNCGGDVYSEIIGREKRRIVLQIGLEKIKQILWG